MGICKIKNLANWPKSLQKIGLPGFRRWFSQNAHVRTCGDSDPTSVICDG